ncbi:MAG TPA: hypothetical protein VJ371_14380 [Streptosporangiaceae bacterium]|nr:hypothetical protein [Streptosporangiaceae bacterium]
MDGLADSASLVDDPGGLRRCLGDHGYLFFRGLLPASEVEAAGQTVLARLRSGGWVDDRGIPSVQPHAVNSMDALADPAFRAAMASADFNRLPYLPPLREMVRAVLGPAAFSYPVKVLRAVYPERPEARPRVSPGRPGRRPARTLTASHRAPGLEALAPAAPGGRTLGATAGKRIVILVPAKRYT